MFIFSNLTNPTNKHAQAQPLPPSWLQQGFLLDLMSCSFGRLWYFNSRLASRLLKCALESPIHLHLGKIYSVSTIVMLKANSCILSLGAACSVWCFPGVWTQFSAFFQWILLVSHSTSHTPYWIFLNNLFSSDQHLLFLQPHLSFFPLSPNFLHLLTPTLQSLKLPTYVITLSACSSLPHLYVNEWVWKCMDDHLGCGINDVHAYNMCMLFSLRPYSLMLWVMKQLTITSVTALTESEPLSPSDIIVINYSIVHQETVPKHSVEAQISLYGSFIVFFITQRSSLVYSAHHNIYSAFNCLIFLLVMCL